jgi:hypothetical protein
MSVSRFSWGLPFTQRAYGASRVALGHLQSLAQADRHEYLAAVRSGLSRVGAHSHTVR